MNLSLLLDMAVDGFGERVVVGPQREGLTAQQLQTLARVAATDVQRSGAREMIYLGLNGPAFPVALFAAALAGVPLVPLNYRLGNEQLAALLARHPEAYLIVGHEQQALLDEEQQARALTPEAWLQLLRSLPHELPEETDESSPVVIVYTSGTTSTPKGVVLRHENLVSYVLSSVEFMSAEGDDAALVSVPPYHIAAIANVITNLYAGRRVLVLEQFQPRTWLNLVADELVTNALVVPTMLARILEAVNDGDTLTSLRSLAYGGAPMTRTCIEAAMARWPHIDFVNAYGLTETSSTISVLGPEDHRTAFAATDPSVRARLGSAGRPLPSIELEVRDETGRVVDEGATGLIWVRGDQVSAEYAGAGAAVDERGFFNTRDQGYIDAEGYLFLAGRADDTIIRGAENIAPAEIEDVLLRHDAVLDAVVVGIPDNEWGQRIEAAVVLSVEGAVGEEELRSFVRDHLRSSKTPQRIAFWTELPRNEMGKLVRRAAVERLASC